jgi:hypothetical protein
MAPIQGTKGKSLADVSKMVLETDVKMVRYLGQSRKNGLEHSTYVVKAGKKMAVISVTQDGWVREEEIEQKIRENECST